MNDILKAFMDPLVWPAASALALGALAYLLSRWWKLACKLLALAAAGCVLAGGAGILSRHMDRTFAWDWLRLTDNVVLSMQLAPTGLGMIVVMGSAVFAALIAVYSIRAMAGNVWEGKFYAYLAWTLAGACLVGLADNLLVLLIGWEFVTLMLFLMINQGAARAPAGAAKTYGLLGFADACLLLALALLASMEGGSDNLVFPREPTELGASSMGAAGYVVYSLILIAALAKAGAVPLHTWIPAAAEGAPAPVMAYLPAALDKLLGIYLLAVLSLRMFRPDWTLRVIMMSLGAVTILAAVLMAMIQHNLKKLLSFHAVSQVGYMVLGIGTGTTIGVIGGLFHMINNALYKCGLFLMSGTVGRAAGSDEVERMGGLARALPVTFICGLVAAGAISGVPPLNGFASKWLVYQGTLEVSAENSGLAVALVTAAVLGSALTLASFVKVIYSAFLSPAPPDAPYAATRVRESFWLASPMVLLAAACIALGVAPQLMTEGVLKPALAAVGTTGEALSTDAAGALSTGQLGLWAPGTAAVLIAIGLLLGAALSLVAGIGRKVRLVRPFLGGEVAGPGDDRFRVPGTHFYETVVKTPLIGPLLGHGQRGAMDLYHWSAKHGNTLVQVLRARHTGLVSLYLAWVLMGLTITLVYLLLSARA